MQFLVTPGVENYQAQMRAVKELVGKTLDIALIDFLMVSAVFKIYRQHSQKQNANLSSAIKKLQYMDILAQKLNHICQLNEYLIQSETQSNHAVHDQAGFIFKVNYCQSVVAAYEFRANAEGLVNDLAALRESSAQASGLNFSKGPYLSNQNEVAQELSAISEALNEMQQQRFREAPTSLQFTTEINGISNNLYTMASERFVLLWLLKHNSGTVRDLLEEYQEDGYNEAASEIDLF
jgi:hypothetical protein